MHAETVPAPWKLPDQDRFAGSFTRRLLLTPFRVHLRKRAIVHFNRRELEPSAAPAAPCLSCELPLTVVQFGSGPRPSRHSRLGIAVDGKAGVHHSEHSCLQAAEEWDCG